MVGRHKDPECYKKDAEILENEYWIEVVNSNIEMARRYAFYCAQSYKDIGNNEPRHSNTINNIYNIMVGFKRNFIHIFK